MKKKISIIPFTFLIVIVFNSCSKKITSPTTQIISLPLNGEKVINANNHFAFDILKATLARDPANNNKLISPLSIYFALSMVYNGAANSTKDSIARTLQISGLDINSLNSVCHVLISKLPKEDNKVQLNIANSIWYRRNSFQPLPSFLNVLKNNYNASINPIDFDASSAIKTINDWVSQKTNDKISKIIETISLDDLMYLINAVYFNGSWQHEFKSIDTHNDSFYLQDGTTKNVPFMSQEIKANIYSDSSFSMMELPYGDGKSFSMFLIEPGKSEKSINEFASSIDENILMTAIKKMDSSTVKLVMPKWEYSYEITDMKPELTAMGMGIAFQNNADFSNIYNPSQTKVSISKAIHKAYIKVNEKGTEAAAVTSVGITMTSIMIPRVLKIDHPFMYAIIEKQTGAVLFLGIVQEP